MNGIYAGVGSRETPVEILLFIAQIARYLGQNGWKLRSGGAAGADTEFENNSPVSEIYLPTGAYKLKSSIGAILGMAGDIYWQEAGRVAAKHHPSWFTLKPSSRALHTRNVFQILGLNLIEPSDCVICWTPDAATGVERFTSYKTGGTGQAIRIAAANQIPVHNLADPWTRTRFVEMVNGVGPEILEVLT